MIRNIFLSVFETSISTGFMIILFMLLSPLVVRRYAAKWKYWVWLFLALWLIVPVKEIESRWAVWGGVPGAGVASENVGDIVVDAKEMTSPIMIEIPTRMTAGILSLSRESPRNITMLDITSIIWLLGGMAFISVHLISYLRYRKRLMKQGMPIEDEEIWGLLWELKCELRIKGRVCLRKYSRAASPMLIGFFRPVIVLPKEEYSRDELFFILKHELIHLKRHDVWLKLLLVTAKGMHWFNPVVWLMQKEAVIDMEMSCDERVVKNANYVMKKAYTETLLSTIHRQYARQTLLSTQFKGGKQIMKKRFQNILSGGKKKNGLLLFTGVAVMTVSLGMLVGCSVGEPLANKAADAIESIPVDGEKAAGALQELEEKEVEEAGMKTDGGAFPESILPETDPENEKMVLIFMKEGEVQEIPATLFSGEGYSIYIPDEGFNLSDSNDGMASDAFERCGLEKWNSEINGQVSLWVNKYDGNLLEEIEEGLMVKGYREDGMEMVMAETGLVYRARLIPSEAGCYGVFYCYPEEAEEGFGRDLSVIADSFAISKTAEDLMKEEVQEVPAADPLQQAITLVEDFSKAYFADDTDSLKQYLADSYVGDAEGFPGGESVTIENIKGLTDAENTKTGESCIGSVEFKGKEEDDYYQYLTVELVKEGSGWKVGYYGLEM